MPTLRRTLTALQGRRRRRGVGSDVLGGSDRRAASRRSMSPPPLPHSPPMSARATPARSPFALDAEAQAELRARCERAIGRARRSGAEVLVGITVAVDPAVDPSAVVFASRRAGEDWFCFEQPDRGGAALAALGVVRRLSGEGAGRFPAVAAAWRRLAGEAVADAPGGPPGAGLVAVGGFAFAPEGGAAPHWAGFGSGAVVVAQGGVVPPDCTS